MRSARLPSSPFVLATLLFAGPLTVGCGVAAPDDAPTPSPSGLTLAAINAVGTKYDPIASVPAPTYPGGDIEVPDVAPPDLPQIPPPDPFGAAPPDDSDEPQLPAVPSIENPGVQL